MAPQIFRSTDAGAPALRGNVLGDLVALLTAVLVDGYGSTPGAGWSRPFVNAAGTVAVFRAPSGNRRYLRVDDSRPVWGSVYRNARLRMYDTMTDVDTGTGEAPLPATDAVGVAAYVFSGGSAASARPWRLVADEACFYFDSLANADAPLTGDSGSHLVFFGDILARGPLDEWATMLVAQRYENTNSGGAQTSAETAWLTASTSSVPTTTGQAFARRYDGVGAATREMCFMSGAGGITSANLLPLGGTGYSYPDALAGTVLASEVAVNDATLGTVLRGQMPGMLVPLHGSAAALTRWDEFDGSGDLAGGRYICLHRQGPCSIWLRTDAPWRP